MRLLFLFTVIPVVELYLLISLGQVTSAATVVAIVLVTGVVGAALAKHQGLGVLHRIQMELNAGRLPAGELVDGLLILVGGAFLITPGVMTDAVGLCMLIPLTRAAFRQGVKRWLSRKIESGDLQVHSSSQSHYDFDMDDEA